MERLRIPNLATYLPVAPSDLLLAAPVAARVLFGLSPAGRALQAAALGVYAGSALIDWAVRADARRGGRRRPPAAWRSGCLVPVP